MVLPIPVLRMSKLLRYNHPSSLYFITCVTHGRKPILVEHADLLLSSIDRMRADANFTPIAWVVLPDHFHLTLDLGSGDISTVMQRIKLSFSANYRKMYALIEGRTWKSRFWDHIIRDRTDLNLHLDYIHYNPVKHGLASAPRNWRLSSIHQPPYVSIYAPDWGAREPDGLSGDFGE